MGQLTIDFTGFTHGNSSERQKVAEQLRNTLTSHGYMKLVGHGVPDWAMAKLFELVRKP